MESASLADGGFDDGAALAETAGEPAAQASFSASSAASRSASWEPRKWAKEHHRQLCMATDEWANGLFIAEGRFGLMGSGVGRVL